MQIAGRTSRFRRGEAIHTEWSHKYTLAQIRALADAAGLKVERFYCDPRRSFSVSLLVPKAR